MPPPEVEVRVVRPGDGADAAATGNASAGPLATVPALSAKIARGSSPGGAGIGGERRATSGGRGVAGAARTTSRRWVATGAWAGAAAEGVAAPGALCGNGRSASAITVTSTAAGSAIGLGAAGANARTPPMVTAAVACTAADMSTAAPPRRIHGAVRRARSVASIDEPILRPARTSSTDRDRRAMGGDDVEGGEGEGPASDALATLPCPLNLSCAFRPSFRWRRRGRGGGGGPRCARGRV